MADSGSKSSNVYTVLVTVSAISLLFAVGYVWMKLAAMTGSWIPGVAGG